MSSNPTPPDHGWSLCEAAAILFPAEWAAATFPTDISEARKRPGIEPFDNPLTGKPLEQVQRIRDAVLLHDLNVSVIGEVPEEDEALLRDYVTYEKECAHNILEARKKILPAQQILPRLFADRMARGDLLAFGIDPYASSFDTQPILIQPHLWGVATPHFCFSTTEKPGTVTDLPGGSKLLGVRIKAAPAPADASSAGAVAPRVPGAAPDIIYTGAPGRPTSMHLIRTEHARRLATGEAHQTLANESRHLEAWFRAAHPNAPTPKAKTIANAIRESHNRARNGRPK